MSPLLFAVTLLFTTALGSAILAAYVWRQRQVTSGRYFALCMTAVACWACATAASYVGATLTSRLVWSNLQYVGIVLVPPFWFLFSLEYTGRSADITPLTKGLLSLHPILVHLALWTNGSHHLFHSNVWLETTGPFPTIGNQHGPLFWMHTVYAYSLLLMGFYHLLSMPRPTRVIYRRQTLALAIALVLPWGANVVTLAGAARLANFDLTPFAFAISGIVVSWALLRHQLFDLAPVALGIVIENLSDAIIVLDTQKRVAQINSEGATLLGCAPDVILGRRLVDILPDYADLIQRYSDVESGHETLTLACSPCWQNGGTPAPEPTLDMRFTTLREAHGRRIGYLISLQNISERLHAQRALRQISDRLRILHAIDQAILSAQSPEMIAQAALEQIHHLVPSQRASVLVLGDDERVRLLALRALSPLRDDDTVWQDRLAAQELNLLDVFSLDHLSGSEDAPVFECRLYAEGVRSCLVVPLIAHEAVIGTLNLESADVHAFTAEHADIAAQVATSLAVALDSARLYAEAQQELTERKAVEAALRASEATLRQKADDLAQRNAELDAFAHTVAHDLKMPLSLMIGYTSFIEAGEVQDDPDQLNWCVQTIGQSARKMGNIIDELLLLASFRKVGDVTVKPLDMGAIVSDVLIRFTDLLEQRHVEITRPEVWPIAWGHAPWIEEVWANYLSNAIKYGGAPPHIELGADPVVFAEAEAVAPAEAPTLPAVRFWVRDNGNGLSAEQQQRLFVPFERLDQARAQGHGLGLSIVQRIVEKLNGTAGVESENGHGSTFYFTLPQRELPQ